MIISSIKRNRIRGALKKNKMITLITTFLIVLCLCGCSYMYFKDEIVDNIRYCYSSFGHTCFVNYYKWDGLPEHMTINIPDTVNGYKVSELGGYAGKGVPCPFGIYMPKEYSTGM